MLITLGITIRLWSFCLRYRSEIQYRMEDKARDELGTSKKQLYSTLKMNYFSGICKRIALSY